MRQLRLLALVLVGAVFATGCVVIEPRLEMPVLAHAEVTTDFDTYPIRRVGLMPFTGVGLTQAQSHALQMAFLSEMSQSSPYEVILLDADDLEEVERSEPHRRGWYRPRTIISVSRRYSLDAIAFGTVTQQRFYPPQILALSIELVASETGLVVWSASVHLDATDQRVVDGLQVYYGAQEEDSNWELALLSPERFARFAAYQIARML